MVALNEILNLRREGKKDIENLNKEAKASGDTAFFWNEDDF